MFCNKCGTKTQQQGSAFCENCGAALLVGEASQQQPSFTTVTEQMVTAQMAPPIYELPAKKSKRYLLLIIPVVIIFIAGLATFIILNNRGIALNETFIDRIEGISFNFPSDWVVFGDDDLFWFRRNLGHNTRLVAKLYQPRSLLSHEYIYFPDIPNVYASLTMDVYRIPFNRDVFTASLRDIRLEWSEVYHNFELLMLEDLNINGIEVRKLAFTYTDFSSGLNGFMKYYFFAVEDTVYRVIFQTSPRYKDDESEIFEAVINSFRFF